MNQFIDFVLSLGDYLLTSVLRGFVVTAIIFWLLGKVLGEPEMTFFRALSVGFLSQLGFWLPAALGLDLPVSPVMAAVVSCVLLTGIGLMTVVGVSAKEAAMMLVAYTVVVVLGEQFGYLDLDLIIAPGPGLGPRSLP